MFLITACLVISSGSRLVVVNKNGDVGFGGACKTAVAILS